MEGRSPSSVRSISLSAIRRRLWGRWRSAIRKVNGFSRFKLPIGRPIVFLRLNSESIMQIGNGTKRNAAPALMRDFPARFVGLNWGPERLVIKISRHCVGGRRLHPREPRHILARREAQAGEIAQIESARYLGHRDHDRRADCEAGAGAATSPQRHAAV